MDAAAGLFFHALDWFISLPAEFQAFLGICAFVAIVGGLLWISEKVDS